ncbi:MAG: type II toxin-antitoxin system RelE/ParE family toxin [Oxalobacteraceae bacterium]|nr:MAG: type II toxin-antitoxin system RelE/ParE family toxin [Oxalobacteraceae bacterium]
MAHVLKTARAELDLDDIWFYIASRNVAAADRLLDDISHSSGQLAIQPLMGRGRGELALGLRSFPVARYVLFYRPVLAGIEIVRVLHSSRDIPAVSDQNGFAAD